MCEDLQPAALRLGSAARFVCMKLSLRLTGKFLHLNVLMHIVWMSHHAGDGCSSALSLGLFVWSEDYHLNELHKPRL